MNPKTDRLIDENPFEGLRIDNWEILDTVNERQLCQVCKKSRKYFCYNCYVPVEELKHKVPKVKLPVKIDVIKHAREIDGKSTAAHAAVLAPDNVSIFTYPCIPDYGTDERVVLIYPGKNAVSVKNIFESSLLRGEESGEPKPKKLNVGSQLPITKAVFIDSTWNQSRGIYKDQRLRDLPCVVLQSRISQFWRHQNGSPRWYLATVEAIHQFLVELHEEAWNSRCSVEEVSEQSSCESSSGAYHSFGPYNGEYDNLLFFFRYMYSKIHSLYDHEDLKAYKRPLK